MRTNAWAASVCPPRAGPDYWAARATGQPATRRARPGYCLGRGMRLASFSRKLLDELLEEGEDLPMDRFGEDLPHRVIGPSSPLTPREEPVETRPQGLRLGGPTHQKRAKRLGYCQTVRGVLAFRLEAVPSLVQPRDRTLEALDELALLLHGAVPLLFRGDQL